MVVVGVVVACLAGTGIFLLARGKAEVDKEVATEAAATVVVVNCAGSWGEWSWLPTSSCSLECGGGTQRRYYSIATTARNGGTACPDPLFEQQPCNSDPCPPPPPAAVDCVGSWGAGGYGACSETCGGGMQSKTYSVRHTAAHGGAECLAADGEEQSRGCNDEPCASTLPADCAGSWGDWSYSSDKTCSKECGNGTQQRTYSVSTTPRNGGEACPTDSPQTQACNTQSCQVEHVVAQPGTICRYYQAVDAPLEIANPGFTSCLCGPLRVEMVDDSSGRRQLHETSNPLYCPSITSHSNQNGCGETPFAASMRCVATLLLVLPMRCNRPPSICQPAQLVATKPPPVLKSL